MRRTVRIAGAAAGVLLLVLALGCQESAGTRGVLAAADTVRVLIYNIKHGLGMDEQVDLARSARLIRGLQPDVVLLQEIDSSTARTGGVRQAAVLAERTGLPHYAFGRFMDYQGGAYGQAILSRWPILSHTNHPLPPGPEPRTALAARIPVDEEGPEVLFVGLHLYGDPEERLAQARALIDLFGSAPLPVVLGGDFNSQPDSPVIDTLSRHWTIPDKGDDHLTFPSDTPRIEIDYLMYRPQDRFAVAEHRVVDEPLVSDHRPVLLDLVVHPRER